MVTLAPEEDGGEMLIRLLKEEGITVSAGHSGATVDQIEAAEKCGLSCITHTFNAQSPLHHRQAGVVGAALLNDGLYCEVIADAVHVSVPALKLLIKSKPAEKLILITDAMRAKVAAEGVSELGGQTVYVNDGQARLKDGSLAGSVLKMNVAVKNLVEKCGAPVEYALDCASYNPACNLGLQEEYGSIRCGAAADFTLLDGKFNVVTTVVGGEVVSSMLAVICVTVSFCSNLVMVQDKISGANKDFAITPVKKPVLALSYFVGTLAVTLLICFTAMLLCFIYLGATGWFLSAADVFLLMLDIVLLTLFGTALSSLINCFINTQGQASAVGTIVNLNRGQNGYI